MIKRRWFQLHLSTAVLLMFISGAMVGSNVVLRNEPIEAWASIPFTVVPIEFAQSRGWPMVFQTWIEVPKNLRNSNDVRITYDAGRHVQIMNPGEQWFMYSQNDNKMYWNALIALMLLVLCGLISETLIHRRARSTQNP